MPLKQVDKEYSQALCAFLQGVYGLDIFALTPAKRGWWGETWRADTPSGSYFVKLDRWACHREHFRESLAVVDWMTAQGIAHIPPVVRTGNGALHAEFAGAVVGVFPFVEGENREDYPLPCLFERLAPIYRLPSPPIPVRREDFDASCIAYYTDGLERLREMGYVSEAAQLRRNEGRMQRYAERLTLFAGRCRSMDNRLYLTHGDAGGNCILDGENFTIIDWDYPMLAPVERDAWFFLCEQKNIDDFNAALARHGVDEQLLPDRLAYYAYFSLFYYAHEILMCLYELPPQADHRPLLDNILTLADGWIRHQLAVADIYR